MLFVMVDVIHRPHKLWLLASRMKTYENILFVILHLWGIGNQLAPIKMKEISEREFIARLTNEQLLELVFQQSKTIQQKDVLLKRLLAKFTGCGNDSNLHENWLNWETPFNELLKNPKMLKSAINNLIERKNVVLAEKDDQIASKDKMIKLLRVISCVPMYLIAHIEEFQKRFNAVHQCSGDEDSQSMKEGCFEFIASSEDPFTESIRKQFESSRSAMLPRTFCESIISLLSNSRFQLTHFAIKFQQALIEGEPRMRDAGVFRVNELQVKAFNILLTVSGLPNINRTEDNELQVSVCDDNEYLEKYYNYSRPGSIRAGTL